MKTYGLFGGLRVKALMALAAGAALAQPMPADSQPSPSAVRRFLERDYLLGDWHGARQRLSERGVDFELLYAAAVPSAVAGGIKSGSVYQGALLAMLNVDVEKLGLWAHGGFRASALSLHSGAAFSKTHVGDLNQVSMLDFPDTFRLWELWYEHKFLEGKVALKAGQLDIGMDFIVPEFYNSLGLVNFLNQTFFYPTMAFNVYDQPFFPAGHHGLASTPYAAPGARLRVDPSPVFYAQAGVYDGNPDRSFSGTRVNLNRDEGALAYLEFGYRHNQRPDSDGPPGHLKLGAWYHTDDFVDMLDGAQVAFDNVLASRGKPKLSDTLAALGLQVPRAYTAPRWRSGNYGVYFLADHILWRERAKDDPAQQGLAGFFRAGWAPKDRNLAQLGLDGGLVYKGLIPSRDWDTVGLAVSYLEISDDLRRAQDVIRTTLEALVPGTGRAVPRADYEAVLEIGYRAQLAAWASLQTSVQRVFHPGGRVAADIADAWVVIVQTTIRF